MAFKKFKRETDASKLGENLNVQYPPMVAGTRYAAIPHNWGPDLGKSRRGNIRGSNLVMQACTVSSDDIDRDNNTVNTEGKKIVNLELPNQVARQLGIMNSESIKSSNDADEVFVFTLKTRHVHVDADEERGYKAIDFDTVELDGNVLVCKEA